MLIEILTDSRIIALVVAFIGALVLIIKFMSMIMWKIGKWGFDQWNTAQIEKDKKTKENFNSLNKSIKDFSISLDHGLTETKKEITKLSSMLNGHDNRIGKIENHLKIEE